MGTTWWIPTLPTCLNLPLLPHVLTYLLSQKHNIPIPARAARASFLSHPLARVLLVPGWITEALPLVPPRGWEIRTAMRLMLRDWKLAPGWGVSACRPSGRIHWLPPSQLEKQDSPLCQLRIVMSDRFSFPCECE